MGSSKKYTQFSGGNPFGSQAKLLLHHDRLFQYLNKGDTVPVFMEVNPTNACNLRCKWCITENARGKEELDPKALIRYVHDFAEMGGKAITASGGGEPTQYSHFYDFVVESKKAGLDLGLMTNGVFKEEYREIIGENFEWARFSVDTLDQKRYQEWKGCNKIDKVVKNIESLVDSSIRVGVNCNIGEDLLVDDAKALIDWVGDGNADYLQFRPILPRAFKPEENPQLNLPVWKFLDSMKGLPFLNLSDDKRSDIESGYVFPFRSCEGHFFEPILDATGEVKVCMYHPRDSRFTFGNIHENSFKEIWESDQRKKAIEFVRSLDYKENCQMCCKLAEPNKLIDFLKHPEEMLDINFL